MGFFSQKDTRFITFSFLNASSKATIPTRTPIVHKKNIAHSGHHTQFKMFRITTRTIVKAVSPAHITSYRSLSQRPWKFSSTKPAYKPTVSTRDEKPTWLDLVKTITTAMDGLQSSGVFHFPAPTHDLEKRVDLLSHQLGALCNWGSEERAEEETRVELTSERLRQWEEEKRLLRKKWQPEEDNAELKVKSVMSIK
jgi:hypothetical protein